MMRWKRWPQAARVCLGACLLAGSGCCVVGTAVGVAGTAAGAAVGVAGTAVGAATAVAGTAVGVGGAAVGAGVGLAGAGLGAAVSAVSHCRCGVNHEADRSVQDVGAGARPGGDAVAGSDSWTRI